MKTENATRTTRGERLSLTGKLLFVVFALVMGALILQGGFPPQNVEAAISQSKAWGQQYGATAYPGGAVNANYSVPAGTDRLLVMAVSSTRTTIGTQTCSAAFNGAAMTLANSDAAAANQWNHTYLFYMKDANIGSGAQNRALNLTCSGGTQYYTYAYAAVFDGVDQTTPLTDSKNFNSATADSAVGPFSPGLTVNDGDQAIEVVNIARSATGTTARTISTWATGWTTANGLNSTSIVTSGPTMASYVRNRDITTAGTDTSQHTASSTSTWDSMTAMTLKMATAAPSCTYSNPTVSLSSNQNANQGATNNYTLTVTNNDSGGACNATTFSLSKTDNPSVPNANFTASSLPASIGPINPGSFATVTLSHTAAATATVGSIQTTYARTASDANHGAVNSNTITSTVTDGYAPSPSSISSPSNGATLNLASASPTTITGTAADTTGGSGIASVAINVGGGNFVAATCSNCPTSGSATANWSYNWTLPAVQSTGYNIQSRATDVSGKTSSLGSGNIMVTVDRVRPTVSSTTPTTGASNVLLNSAVTINWNENVDCTTVTTSTVTISPSVTWNKTSCSGTQAVFTPSGQSGSTSYTVSVTTGVTDTAGNAMSSSYNWGYTTEVSAAPSPPTGLSLSNMTRHGPQVSWNASAGAAQYKVYRSDDNATWGSAIGTVSDPTTTYMDNTAPWSNTVYYWTVTAVSGGESSKPAAVMGRTSLHKGYNMISAPYNTTGLSSTTVFGVWAYNSWLWQSGGSANPDTNGSYLKPATLVPGKSVFTWAWDETTNLTASGSANGAVTVTLLPGWNMISNPTLTTMNSISTTWLIDGSSIMAAVNGTAPFSSSVIGGAISWWDGNTYDSGNIVSDPPVEPWKGYFILNLDTVSHTLTIQ